MGYSHEAVKIFMPSGASAPVYAPYVEHVPPDVTACIFWLKNRRPQEWRDQRDLTVKHDYSDMETVDQLIDAVAKECGESMAKRLMELTNDEQARLVEIAPDSTHDGSESVQ